PRPSSAQLHSLPLHDAVPISLGRDVIARQSAKARSMISSTAAVGQPAGSSPKRPMLILTSAVPERMCALVHGHLFDTNVEALLKVPSVAGTRNPEPSSSLPPWSMRAATKAVEA